MRFNRRALVAAASLALGLTCAVGVAAASTYTSGPLIQVSGTSPFLGCTADDVPTQSENGTVYLNSEVEPWIDVNPANTSNIVGIWQQDRWSNGGARGLVAGVSMNGGGSWSIVPVPKVTRCSGGNATNGGNYQRATDPWVSFGPTGIVYQLALSFNDVAPPFTAEDFDHALLASRSTDGGVTWSDPVVVRRDLDANVFNDKQSITADPTNANFVYAVWDRLVFPTSERASVISSFHAASYRGPIWFARSTTAGVTWEPARQLHDPGQNDQAIGTQILVLPNGTLVLAYNEIHNENAQKRRGNSIRVMLSTDKGVTWSAPIFVDLLGTIEIHDPEVGDYIRTADIIPDFAVDPSSGVLWAAWQDARPNANQADAIVVARSNDGGHTWLPFAKVNKTPTNIPIGNQQAFTPSVHVSSDGTVAVTYYDFRANTSDPATLPTDYFIVHCHPIAPTACTSSSDWGNEIKLTDVSFDHRKAPDAGGPFVGDYAGLASAGTTFTTFFSQVHGTDPASTFFRKVGP